MTPDEAMAEATRVVQEATAQALGLPAGIVLSVNPDGTVTVLMQGTLRSVTVHAQGVRPTYAVRCKCAICSVRASDVEAEADTEPAGDCPCGRSRAGCTFHDPRLAKGTP